MNTPTPSATKSLCLALLLAGSAAAQRVDWDKTVGNDDAKANISFTSRAIQDTDPFLIKRYFARAAFVADGKVLGKHLDFIDVGASADSHEGGYVFTSSGLFPVGPSNTAKVWFYIGGKQLHTDGATSWTFEKTIPIAGVNKSVTVGLFTVKVSAGPSVTVGPKLNAYVGSRKAEISAGADASLNVSASGSISAGPIGSVKVTSKLGLISLGAALTSKSNPSFVGGGMTLSGAALSILIKIKCVVAGSLISYSETLVDKTYGSWSRFFGF